MIRILALLTTLALVATLCLACGASGDSRTPTLTSTPTISTSAPAAGAGNWTISGQLAGSMGIQTSACQLGGQAGPKFGAQLTGTLNGIVIGIFFASTFGGTLDLSKTSIDTIVSVHYGAAGSAINNSWFALAGNPGVAGTETIDSKGNGSMDVTLPPGGSPSGAAQSITIAGQWTCP
jgi:hypothetical protein